MNAVRILARGGPEQLVCQEVAAPAPASGEALVEVRACGITPNELTWDRVPGIPGHEISGVVEKVKGDAGGLSPGGKVYGLADFERDGGAAVPLSGLTARQALFDHGGLLAGMRVLIHLASGGVGTFAVQLASWRGAHVIATASRHNFELLRELGADELIDYQSERFERKARDIDVVLDLIGGETRRRSWGALRKGGALVTITGPLKEGEPSWRGVRGAFFVVTPNRPQLAEIGRLIDEGALRPAIEAVLPLDRAREALDRGLGGHNRGKLVLRVAAQGAAAR